MKWNILTPQGPVAVTLTRLTPERLDETTALCGRCVGSGLHTVEMLSHILHDPNHAFFLLLGPEGKAIGYQHVTKVTAQEMAQASKLTAAQYTNLCEHPDPVIADLCATGLDAPYRKYGLARAMIKNSLSYAKDNWAADMAVGVCWRNGDTVSIAPTLIPLGFQFLADAQRVWYDCETLVCPNCVGRCECSAAIYYKLFSKGGSL